MRRTSSQWSKNYRIISAVSRAIVFVCNRLCEWTFQTYFQVWSPRQVLQSHPLPISPPFSKHPQRGSKIASLKNPHRAKELQNSDVLRQGKPLRLGDGVNPCPQEEELQVSQLPVSAVKKGPELLTALDFITLSLRPNFRGFKV